MEFPTPPPRAPALTTTPCWPEHQTPPLRSSLFAEAPDVSTPLPAAPTELVHTGGSSAVELVSADSSFPQSCSPLCSSSSPLPPLLQYSYRLPARGGAIERATSRLVRGGIGGSRWKALPQTSSSGLAVHRSLPLTLGDSGPRYATGMEGLHDDHITCHHSEQHSDHVSDSVEDVISDEDVIAPTGLSLVCAASKQREKDNRMVDQDESAAWDEVLEEADELAYVHKDTLSGSYLSAGASKRHKCDNRLRFSIRGSNSAALNVKSGKSGNGEQEVSSGMPSTKASQTIMAELLENINEETDHLPEFSRPMEKANISVAELLEDLQDRSGSSVGTPFSLHQHTRAMEGKLKFPTGKKILALLGQRNLYSDDPLEHVIGETSSDEEDITQNHLTLVNKGFKGQTMTDLFQEVFNPANMEYTALPMRSNGAGYYGRMQQIMQMEKDRAEFLRQYSREQDDLGGSKGFTVEILSRSLEGKLTVCHCLFKEKSNSPVTGKLSTDCDMDDNSIKRTVIFSPKICDNMDLVAGNIVHIYPPWKEVKVKEGEVIICTYFTHHGP